MIPDEIEAQFSRLAASPDDEIDVALGALLIAAANYPELDIPSQMAPPGRTGGRRLRPAW